MKLIDKLNMLELKLPRQLWVALIVIAAVLAGYIVWKNFTL